MSSASSSTSESVPSTDNFFSITEEGKSLINFAYRVSTFLFYFFHKTKKKIVIISDTPQNSPHHLNKSSGSISNLQNATHHPPPNNGSVTSVRTRRLSNSSMASDVSFRLPTFDSSASAYNFHSDLDASASEFEDSASTVGYEAQLDVISKDKLYDAYKKSSERYQKYRSKYTELVRRYRDLERDNNKARVSYYKIDFFPPHECQCD